MNTDEVGFVLAVLFTLGVSGLCLVLEAMILSTTASEIEGLRKKRPKLGVLLDKFKREMEETTSAILTLSIRNWPPHPTHLSPSPRVTVWWKGADLGADGVGSGGCAVFRRKGMQRHDSRPARHR